MLYLPPRQIIIQPWEIGWLLEREWFMRHIFIINPLAGRKGRRQELEEAIESAGRELGARTEIYRTTAAGDGENFARRLCKEAAGREELRFYACGGDGALNELVNGAFGFSNVKVGCVPMGTGNDYVRNYGRPEDFLDIRAQLRAETRESDLIRYTAELGGKELTPRYCMNMFNIGFDCNVVDQTSRAKNWPLVNGSFAYLLSVAIILIKKKGADLKIFYEDGSVFDGKLLLIAVGNGCFCGGGVKGVPLASLSDGKMDVSLIRNVSRRTFVQMFPKYAKGTHLSEPKLREVISYRKCRSLEIQANGSPMRLCTDGEITDADKVRFEVVPGGISFLVPAAAGR